MNETPTTLSVKQVRSHGSVKAAKTTFVITTWPRNNEVLNTSFEASPTHLAPENTGGGDPHPEGRGMRARTPTRTDLDVASRF